MGRLQEVCKIATSCNFLICGPSRWGDRHMFICSEAVTALVDTSMHAQSGRAGAGRVVEQQHGRPSLRSLRPCRPAQCRSGRRHTCEAPSHDVICSLHVVHSMQCPAGLISHATKSRLVKHPDHARAPCCGVDEALITQITQLPCAAAITKEQLSSATTCAADGRRQLA